MNARESLVTEIKVLDEIIHQKTQSLDDLEKWQRFMGEGYSPFMRCQAKEKLGIIARNEQQIPHLLDLRSQLDAILDISHDIVVQKSEYAIIKESADGLAKNLLAAISCNDESSANVYWLELSKQVEWLQEQEEESHTKYGINPARTFYAEVDELGQVEPLSVDESFNVEFSSPYVGSKKILSTGAKISSSNLLMNYSKKIADLNYRPLRGVEASMSTRAQSTIRDLMPRVKNDRAKMYARMGFDGTLRFVQSLSDLQVKAQFGLNKNKKTADWLSDAKALYAANGIQLDEPLFYEKDIVTQKQMLMSDPKVELFRHVNIPLHML